MHIVAGFPIIICLAVRVLDMALESIQLGKADVDGADLRCRDKTQNFEYPAHVQISYQSVSDGSARKAASGQLLGDLGGINGR